MLADLIITNAGELFTCQGPAPRAGARQADAGRLTHAAVASLEGRIVFVGSDADCREAVALAAGGRAVDAAGGAVVPGFVDPHTHLLYAGSRLDELRRRLAGETYADIAAAGGGIVRTVADTREASIDRLVDDGSRRLHEMLTCGTTTAEVKSGYGLCLEAELKLLHAAAALAKAQPIELAITFLGAHEIPPEFRGDREAYLELVIDEMLPAVARAGLAEWCDVFCEQGVFTPEESRRVLEAGLALGLKARIHANELGSTGGASVAAAVGARSADHVVFADENEVRQLAESGTVATLLPAAAFYLKLGRFAPARALIDAGVPVALATDVNPGGGFSPSIPFAMTLACFQMEMTFEEALVASTLNAAYALDRADRVGSLEVDKQLDAVIVGGPPAELLRGGVPAVRLVVKRGAVVWEAPPPFRSDRRE
jgi:imidazolonepropionase